MLCISYIKIYVTSETKLFLEENATFLVLRNHGAADLRLNTSKAGRNRTSVEAKSTYENNEMDEGRTEKEHSENLLSINTER